MARIATAATRINALELAGKRAPDERGCLCTAEQRREGSEARTLRLPEEDFVERLEPVAQRFESVLLADLVDGILHGLAIALVAHGFEAVASSSSAARSFSVGAR